MIQHNSFLPFLFLLFLLGCKTDQQLPYLGQHQKEGDKVVYHKVGTFEMLSQDSLLVSNKDFSNQVYVADFFFTSCPSICPRVTKEMLLLQEAFKDNPKVKLVSFTIDPQRDSVTRLKDYANRVGADQKRWFFLTGDKEKTFDLANTFFVAALEDAEAPGGFDHSGKIVLVDKEGHVRSFSDGTDPSTTPKLIEDIKTLLASYEK